MCPTLPRSRQGTPEIIQAFKDQGIYDPASQTIKFDKSAIQGDFDVSVKAGSTLPLDKGTRDKILNNVYQMSIPLAQAPSVPPFIAEIVKELLKDYEIKGLEAAFDEQGQTQQAKTATAVPAGGYQRPKSDGRNCQAQRAGPECANRYFDKRRFSAWQGHRNFGSRGITLVSWVCRSCGRDSTHIRTMVDGDELIDLCDHHECGNLSAMYGRSTRRVLEWPSVFF